MHFYFCHSRAAPMRLGTMEMRPCGVKRLANMYTIACGVFLARAHLLALPPHRLRSFATFFSPRFSLRRFPCANSSHCTELASSPLFHGIALFSASACLRRLTPVAAFSLHELIPLHRARIFTALSWHCSFNNLFLPAAWFACGHSHSMVAGGFPVMS